MNPAPVTCAALLAGGASRRMGRNKALLEVEGEPLARRTVRLLQQIFLHVVVVSENPATIAVVEAPAIPDLVPDKGPAAGIAAALRHFDQPVFVVACDMPWLQSDVIRLLVSHYQHQPALLPEGPQGPEPLHAIYHPACMPALLANLGQERPPSLRRLLQEAGAARLPAALIQPLSPNFRCFSNWNSPDDLRDTALL